MRNARSWVISCLLTALAAGFAASCERGSEEPQEKVAETTQPVVAATEPYGTMSGYSSVTPSGAYTYTIPLRVPEGVDGLTPSVELTYSSQGGNGLLGVGFSLSASSVITRCARNVGRDGVARQIIHATDFRQQVETYCLDGTKLIPIEVTSQYVAFKSEREEFSRIRGYYAARRPSGLPFYIGDPYSFIVETRDGRVLKYGEPTMTSVNSNALVIAKRHSVNNTWDGTRARFDPVSPQLPTAFAWHLQSVSRRGYPDNEITYHYDSSEYEPGESASRRLVMIRYAATSPYPRSVIFHYSMRPDRIEQYVSGYHVGARTMLTGVEMRGPDADYRVGTLWQYGMEYGAVSKLTARSLLRSIKWCDAAVNCLPATRFEWADAKLTGTPADDYTERMVAFGGGLHDGIDGRDYTRLWLADLDGDGRDDLIHGRGPDETANNLRVRFSTATGFGTERTVAPVRVNPHLSLPADLDGDGRSELILAVDESSGGQQIGRYSPYRWNTTTHTFESDAALSPLFAPERVGHWKRVDVRDTLALGDLNGDGSLDLVANTDRELWPGKLLTHLMRPRDKTSFRTVELNGNPDDDAGGPLLVDLDGDGDAEVRFQNRDAAYSTTPIDDMIRSDGRVPSEITFSDINGDGLKDLVFYTYNNRYLGTGAGTVGAIDVALNTGFGYRAPRRMYSHANFASGIARPATQLRTGDFNGDGREDLLLLDVGAPNLQPNTLRLISAPMVLLMSTGDGYTPYSIATSRPRYRHDGTVDWFFTNAEPMLHSAATVGDVNGDGLSDIVLLGGTTEFDAQIMTLTATGTDSGVQRRDVIVAVYDGLKPLPSVELWGDKVVYSDLPALKTQGRYKLNGACGALAAGDNAMNVCLTRGIQVVASFSTEREGWPENFIQYSYDTARTDLAGRGFLGFESQTATDPLEGRRTTEFQDLTFSRTTVHTAFEPPSLRNPDLPGNILSEEPTRGRIYPFAGMAVRTETVQGELYRPNPPASGPAFAQCVTREPEYVLDSVGAYYTRTRFSWTNEVYVPNQATTPAGYADFCTRSPTRQSSFEADDFDAYNNAGRITTRIGGVVETVVESTFNNYVTESKYLLGELSSRLTTRTRGTQPPVKRKMVYEYRPESGKLWKAHVRSGQFPDALPDADPESSEEESLDDIFLTTEYGYNPNGTLATVTQTGLDKTQAEYFTDPKVRTLTLRYRAPSPSSADPVYASEIVNGKDHTVTLAMHPGFGRPLVVTDPNGVATTYGYDGLGRLRTTAADGAGSSTTTLGPRFASCAACGYRRTDSLSDGTRREFEIDQLGRLKSTAVNTVDGSMVDVIFEYDARGRLYREAQPRVRSMSGGPLYKVFDYDVLGRPAKITNFDSTARTWAYPSLFQTVTEDEVKDKKTYTYDTDGLLAKTEELLTSHLRSGARTVTTHFTYLSDSQLEGVNFNGVGPEYTFKAFTYDELGRRTGYYDRASRWIKTRYNAFGEVRWQQNASDPFQRILRDDLGRVVARISTNGSNIVEEEVFQWDTEKHGLLSRATARHTGTVTKVATDYEYDEYARLKSKSVNWTPSAEDVGMTGPYTIGIEYDFEGREWRRTYPTATIGGATVQAVTRREYERGYLKRIVLEGSGGDQELWRLISATPNEVEEESGGVVETREYLPNGRLSRVTLGDIERHDYAYWEDGNLKRRTYLNGDRDDMKYDSLDRLEVLTHTAGSTVFRREYAYDDFGSMTSAKVFNRATGGSLLEEQVYTVGWTYPGGLFVPWAVAGTSGSVSKTYKYDRSGRRSSMTDESGTRNYTWNHWNLPVSYSGAVNASFLYDADGQRAQKSNGPVVTYYHGDAFEHRRVKMLPMEWRVNFVHANGRAVAQIVDYSVGASTQRTVNYPRHDGLGSVVAMSGGSETPRTYYEPFGQPVAADGRSSVTFPASILATSRHGFTEHEHDGVDGLINMKGRMYDPLLRRFLTPDPVAANADHSQGWNPYAYVRNNPFRYTDPTGFQPREDLPQPGAGGTIGVEFCLQGECEDKVEVVVNGSRPREQGAPPATTTSYLSGSGGQTGAGPVADGAQGRSASPAEPRNETDGRWGVRHVRELTPQELEWQRNGDAIPELEFYIPGVGRGASAVVGATASRLGPVITSQLGPYVRGRILAAYLQSAAPSAAPGVQRLACYADDVASYADDVASYADDVAKAAGGVGAIKFGQASVKSKFAHGPFAGRTIGDVAAGLRAGTISPDQLPIEVVVRNGQAIALNNRSLTALTRAGMQPTQVINRTGDAAAEALLNSHLRGGVPSDVIRIRGAGPGASLIE